MFGMIGRFSVPEVRGLRHHVVVEDGSTVTYDLFEKKEEGVCITHTIVVCPGEADDGGTIESRHWLIPCPLHVSMNNRKLKNLGRGQ